MDRHFLNAFRQWIVPFQACRDKRRNTLQHPRRLMCEGLEDRRLLSRSLMNVAAQPLLPDSGATESSALPFATFNTATYFLTGDQYTNAKLWKTDGASTGTTLIKDLGAMGAPGSLVVSGSVLYFNAAGQLWKSDGTGPNTTVVSGISNPRELTPDGNGNLFYTTADTNGAPEKMWKFNGSTTQTVVTSQYPPSGLGFAAEGPQNLVNVNGTIFFIEAVSPGPYQLFKYNGTPESITQITTQTYLDCIGQNVSDQAVLGGKLYFTATDYADNSLQHLYVVNSDGTGMTTHGLTPLGHSANASLLPVATSDGTVYFGCSDASGNSQIWKTNSTAAGTSRVTNINAPGVPTAYGSSGLNPQSLLAIGGNAYFSGDFSNTIGNELGMINATNPAGVLVADIFPGVSGSDPNGSYPANFLAVGNTFEFIASSHAGQSALFLTMGNAASTTQLTPPFGAFGNPYGGAVSAGHFAYFASTTTTTGVDSHNQTVYLPMNYVGLAKTQGDSQTANAGAAFASALQIQVTNGDGTANLAGVQVTFVAPDSGASGTFAASGATATVTTNASGLATAPAFTANATAGSYTVLVQLSGLDTGLAFNLTNNGGAAPEIDVQGQSLSIVSGDSTPSASDDTDFGSTNVVTGTVDHTFSILNTGSGALNLSGVPKVAISGANAADFSVKIQPSSPVAASGQTTFVITFDPSAAGTRTATVTIANDDSDEGTYTFAVQGAGTAAPEIDVQGQSLSIVSGDSTPSASDDTDFGSTNVVTGTVDHTFTILNTGSGALNLSGVPKVAISGANAADFSVKTQPSSPVAASGQTTFVITFDPSAAGTRTATVTIANDDSNEGTYTFAVQGTGQSSQAATTTTLVGAPCPSVYGELVTFTATVTANSAPVTSGTVDFKEGSVLLAGGVALNAAGQAAFSISTLSVSASPHTITAVYNGDADFATSSKAAEQTVSKAELTVTADKKSRDYGTADPEFTATITGFVNQETWETSGGTGSPSLTSDALVDSPAGPYAIHAAVGSLAAGNYSFHFVDGVLTVRHVAPSDLSLLPQSVAEELPIGTLVGTFSSSDPEANDAFTYRLVTGTGDADNGAFSIDASGRLLTAMIFDYETRSSYSIRVRTTDSGGLWHEKPFTISIGDVHDFDTPGLYDPLSSLFYLRNANSAGPADNAFGYGMPGAGWKPLAGDWDGDGIDSVGLYDPQTSCFYLRNTNDTGMADITFGFGDPAAGSRYVPLAGDWDGNGIDSVGLYDPQTAQWYLRSTNTSGMADFSFGYGAASSSWVPLAGDWNGDGIDTIAAYDPQCAAFFLRNSNDTGCADCCFGYGEPGAPWGPVAGDWEGNRDATMSLYDSAHSHWFLHCSNETGACELNFGYGAPAAGWLPIVGNWIGAGGQALRAANGSDRGNEGRAAELSRTPNPQSLTPLVAEGIARWAAAGVSMASPQVVVTDLPGNQLGAAWGRTVYLDRDAAGHGWFIDPTPAMDEEFARLGAEPQLTAIDSRAADAIDLLTVIEHELGHIAGGKDTDALTDSLMSAQLGVGIRRLPNPGC